MSQRATRKRRTALQVAVAVAASLLLGACATLHNDLGDVHPSVGANAKTLRYVETLDHIPLGQTNPFKRFLAGADLQDLDRPTAIGIRDNIMYIADAGVGMIYQYDLNRRRMLPMRDAIAMSSSGDRVLGDVTDIYVNKDYSFFVADNEGQQVLLFSDGGRLLQVFRDDPNVARPIALSYDEAQHQLVVADEFYSHLVFFNEDGEPVRGLGGRGEGDAKFRMITDMFKSKDGYYVSDRVEYSVQLIDNSGTYKTHFGDHDLLFPAAIAMDSEGRVYVSDKSDSRIKVFRDGKLVDVIGKNGYGAGEFRYVSDMKFADNKLYVVDSLNGRIQVFEVLPERR